MAQWGANSLSGQIIYHKSRLAWFIDRTRSCNEWFSIGRQARQSRSWKRNKQVSDNGRVPLNNIQRRVLVEKYLERQKELFHNFIDIKKAFDLVWHDALWRVLKNTTSAASRLIEVIRSLYNEATRAMFLNVANDSRSMPRVSIIPSII